MKKIVIIYKSKGGHTAKYANWLKRKIDADIFEESSANLNMLSMYDLLIFGTGVYGEKFSIAPFIKKNINTIMLKKTILFASCWYGDDVFNRKALAEKNLPAELLGRTKMFLVQGGIDHKKISPADKLTLVKEKMAINNKKEARTTEDIMKLGYISGYSDMSEEADLDKLAEYINEGIWKQSGNTEIGFRVKHPISSVRLP